MQDHRFDFVVDGTPEEVWDVIWKRTRAGIETDTVKIEIYHPGDEDGQRPGPALRLPGPEVPAVQAARPSPGSGSPRPSARCRGGTTPSASHCGPRPRDGPGWRISGDGRTRVYFRETYEAFNPLMRALLEKRVHHFISKGNDKLIEAGLVRR